MSTGLRHTRRIWLAPSEIERDPGPVQTIVPVEFGAFAELAYDAPVRKRQARLLTFAAGSGLVAVAPLLPFLSAPLWTVAAVTTFAGAGALLGAATAFMLLARIRDRSLLMHGDIVTQSLGATPALLRRRPRLAAARLGRAFRARQAGATAGTRLHIASTAALAPLAVALWLARQHLFAATLATIAAGAALTGGAFLLEWVADAHTGRNVRAALTYAERTDKLVRHWPGLREHDATRWLRIGLRRLRAIEVAASRARQVMTRRSLLSLGWVAAALGGAVIFSNAQIMELAGCVWSMTLAAHLGGTIGTDLARMALARREKASIARLLVPGKASSAKVDRIRSLSLDEVSYRYPGSAEPVFCPIDLEIESGDVIALRSDSGTGKTTLLRVIMGLLAPTNGSIRINGSDGTGLTYQHRVAAVFQDDIVGSGTIRQAMSGGSALSLDALWELAALVGIDELVRSLPMGMQTLIVEGPFPRSLLAPVLIARAIAQEPDLLVLDEAFSAFDVERAAALLAGLRARGTTVIFASHDPQIAAMADRVVELVPS